MDFKREKRRYVTVAEMNQHLRYVRDIYRLVFREKTSEDVMARNAFISDKLVTFSLTYKKGFETVTYICRKDGDDTAQSIDGLEAFRILSSYYSIPRMPDKVCGRADEGGLSASPILWYNPRYEGQWIDACSYDINSAYSSAMLGPMPDTSNGWRVGKIKKGEIGFQEVLNPKNEDVTMLVPQYSGFSLYVFPLMESPFKAFVDHWYNIKKNSPKGSRERQKAKEVLNFSVGYLQRVNPFIRATIIGRCNSIIEQLIDPETTLFCNTDSITSRVPLDIPIGEGIGEWKIEKVGKVAYIGNNYQWSDGDVIFRGIPKRWFPRGWDITKDPIPEFWNEYEFRDMQLRRTKRCRKC